MTWKGSLGAALAVAALPLCLQPAAAQSTTRILAMGGAQPNGFSGRPTISADGRFVAFESNATNFVTGDTNARTDIFLYDAQTGVTKRISVATDGTQADRDSFYPSISADGRYVVFESNASNLVAGDTNNSWDIFLHDNQTGETRRVSVDSAGGQGNASSSHASISADGNFVVFESLADNLVQNDTNFFADVFVHELATGKTTRVSVSNSNTEGNRGSGYNATISKDGRYVAFWSEASNLVATDTNGQPDVFIRDTVSNTTTLVSAPAGVQANGEPATPTISADGNVVAFYSTASNIVSGDNNNTGDIFLTDRQTGAVTRVGAAGDLNGWILGTLRPSVSGDGNLTAFSSAVADVIPGKSNGKLQVYLYDRQGGDLALVSATQAGEPGGGLSYTPSVSENGEWVAFISEAADLVPGDTNNAGDVFLRHLVPGAGFTLADAGNALRIAGGLSAATPADATRFGGAVTIVTAVHVARKVAGLEPNP